MILINQYALMKISELNYKYLKLYKVIGESNIRMSYRLSFASGIH